MLSLSRYTEARYNPASRTVLMNIIHACRSPPFALVLHPNLSVTFDPNNLLHPLLFFSE